jgi:hypothetical protein
VVIMACMVSQMTVTQLYYVLSCSKRLCLSEAVSSSIPIEILYAFLMPRACYIPLRLILTGMIAVLV